MDRREFIKAAALASATAVPISYAALTVPISYAALPTLPTTPEVFGRNTIGRFMPASAILPHKSYATFDMVDDRVMVLDFDSMYEEGVMFPGYMPSQFEGNELAARIYYSVSEEARGTVAWKAYIGNGEAAVTQKSPTPDRIKCAEIIIPRHGVKPGDPYGLVINRLSSQDSATTDAVLYMVELQEIMS